MSEPKKKYWEFDNGILMYDPEGPHRWYIRRIVQEYPYQNKQAVLKAIDNEIDKLQTLKAEVNEI